MSTDAPYWEDTTRYEDDATFPSDYTPPENTGATDTGTTPSIETPVETPPSNGSGSYVGAGSGKPGESSNYANIANVVQSTTGVSGDWTDKFFAYMGRSWDNLLTSTEKNPERAVEFLAGAIGNAWKAKEKRDAAAALAQQEIDKENRINSSIPGVKVDTVKGILNKARTKRADGKDLYTGNGQINRSK